MKNIFTLSVVKSHNDQSKQVIVAGNLAGIEFSHLKDFIPVVKQKLTYNERVDVEMTYDPKSDVVAHLRFTVSLADGYQLGTNRWPSTTIRSTQLSAMGNAQ